MPQLEKEIFIEKIETDGTHNSGKSFFEWFVEVVGMSLLPSFLYALLLYCDDKTINVAIIFGNGDLLMAAAIVSAISLLHVLWRKKREFRIQTKIAVTFCLFCVFNCMYLASGVKIGRIPYENMIGVSIGFILCAFISSYAVERY